MLSSGVSLVTDISCQNKAGKITGTVVLMSKTVLDFIALKSKGAATSVSDGLQKICEGEVILHLISSTKVNPGNNMGKVGKAARLEGFVPLLTLLEGQVACRVHFEYDHEFGVPGAFFIKNNLPSEFFLVSLTLDDLPNLGSIQFVCNSWIYPHDKYQSPRIFFANKAYLPSETPAPLRQYRERELNTLRGDGFSECKVWDRVYDYATYNDLGDPDSDKNLARPTLGGSSDYPYPRRGRTSRPPNKSDPSTESRLGPLELSSIYVPRDERFGHTKFSDFLADIIKSLLQVWSKSNPNEFRDFDDVRDLYNGGWKVPQDLLKELREKLRFDPFLSELLRIDGEQFLVFPTPSVIKDNVSGWMTDEEFARETLAGVNPCLIQRLKEFPPKSKLDANIYGDQTSKVTKEQLEKNMNGLSVDEALYSKRLFILDHHDAFMSYLRRINGETGNMAYATRTIFFLKDDGTLKPLAIELSLPHPDGDQHGAVSKVILPALEGVEATIWLLAKAYVTVNDSGIHQLISHWLNTHAIMEPFIIATNRELSVLHPIHKLLHPHFRDTMNLNAFAREALINAGGTIELAFLPGKFSMAMSSKVYKNWVFTDQALPADLIKRGMAVEDPTCPHGLRLAIEDYPFAVDGLEIWAAIKTWVHDYVSCYYDSDDTVKADSELQAWWKDLVEVGHGDLKDEPWWPKIHTRNELIESCTIIIWTASALHAAVNFGQYPYGGYILNRPTLSRRLIPEEGTPEYEEMKMNPEEAFLKTITPKEATLKDLSVIELLSTHASDEVYLGTRDNPNWTCDVKPLQAFKRFGKKLSEIEESLKAKNNDENLRNRIGIVNMPYTLLYPTSEAGITGRGIPNSVSI